MKTKLTSLLSILATGAGCAVGIPIGINTVPEKYEPLTWTQMVDKWEDSWKKVANQAYYTEESRALWEQKETQRLEEVKKDKKLIEEQKKVQDKNYQQRKAHFEWLGRLRMTVKGHLENLEKERQQREREWREKIDQIEKSMEKREWEEEREKIFKEFDKKNKELKNLDAYCHSSCSEDLKQKIKDAKDRVAGRLKWMSIE